MRGGHLEDILEAVRTGDAGGDRDERLQLAG
jgi:hypothetical protein